MYHSRGLGTAYVMPPGWQGPVQTQPGDTVTYQATDEQIAAGWPAYTTTTPLQIGTSGTLTQWLSANAGYLALGAGAFILLLAVGRR